MLTKRKPRHPGALIKRQYLEPINMTNTKLAEILDVSRKTVSEIVTLVPNAEQWVIQYLIVTGVWFTGDPKILIGQ